MLEWGYLLKSVYSCEIQRFCRLMGGRQFDLAL